MIFIVYDLEATCWLGKPPGMKQETIEIGAVAINGYGEFLGDFNRFIKPVMHPILSSFCTDLTSIDQISINRAKKFPDVINDFRDWIEDFDDETYYLCSWGGFDKKMLQRDCELHDQEGEWLEFHLNIKQQYQELKGLRHPRGLMKTVEKEGFEFDGIPHRAIADAENLAKVFVKYLDEWVY